MNLGRITGVFAIAAALSAGPATSWSAPCDVIGGGNHKVCAVLGAPCSPPNNANCVTIIIAKENTQGGDCICRSKSPRFPNDSTFNLSATGVLPSAQGHATIRWLPDGRRAAAIGLRGLDPFTSYQVLSHIGAVGNCSGGTPTPIGPPVVSDAMGDAVVIEDVSTLSPISVEETGGLQRTVICGVGPASLPATPPWGQLLLILILSSAGALALHRVTRVAEPLSS